MVKVRTCLHTLLMMVRGTNFSNPGAAELRYGMCGFFGISGRIFVYLKASQNSVG